MRWRISAPFIKIIATILLLILELRVCHIEWLGLINPIFWHTEKPRNAATFVHNPQLKWKLTNDKEPIFGSIHNPCMYNFYQLVIMFGSVFILANQNSVSNSPQIDWTGLSHLIWSTNFDGRVCTKFQSMITTMSLRPKVSHHSPPIPTATSTIAEAIQEVTRCSSPGGGQALDPLQPALQLSMWQPAGYSTEQCCRVDAEWPLTQGGSLAWGVSGCQWQFQFDGEVSSSTRNKGYIRTMYFP